MPAQGLLENGDLRVRRCRYGFMLYSLNDVYIGRSFELYGEYLEEEAALYRQLLKRGQTVVDAGANIGAFTVLFARIVGVEGLAHAFEPYRRLYHMLCANLALNRLTNVQAHHGAAGRAAGVMTAPPVDFGEPGNFGGVSLTPMGGSEGAGETVPVSALDTLGLERCDLIKIDVEGMEGEVLAGAQATIERFQPLLYVENNRQEKSAALIGQLFELGYRLYWHIPRLFNPKNHFRQAKNIFGDTVNVNMLCLPPGDEREVKLRAIASVEDWWKQDPASQPVNQEA